MGKEASGGSALSIGSSRHKSRAIGGRLSWGEEGVCECKLEIVRMRQGHKDTRTILKFEGREREIRKGADQDRRCANFVSMLLPVGLATFQTSRGGNGRVKMSTRRLIARKLVLHGYLGRRQSGRLL